MKLAALCLMAVFGLALSGASALAQCSNGRCPVPQQSYVTPIVYQTPQWVPVQQPVFESKGTLSADEKVLTLNDGTVYYLGLDGKYREAPPTGVTPKPCECECIKK